MWRQTTKRERRQGEAVAAILERSWRPLPPPLTALPQSLPEVAATLLQTGAAGLAWWRVRTSPLAETPAAKQLRQGYRLHSLQAALHETNLQRAIALLRSAGAEPLLSKGWAVARLYPEAGLRPYGDLDLCVPRGQMGAAARVLNAAAARVGWIDLHAGIDELADHTLDALYARSRLVRLGAVDVRVLGPEDQLRHLCLHFARHGGWRPLWLCDVGMFVENLPADFRWDVCLAGDLRLTDWVIAVIALAARLLGARAPLPVPSPRLPGWLVRTVLREWGSERPGDSHNRDGRPLASYWRRPQGLIHALACRWPNRIEAAVKLRASPFHRLPAVVLQARLALRRARRLVARLPRAFGKKSTVFRPYDVHVGG